MKDPNSNILLRRKTIYRSLRDTENVPITADNWMAPFGQALGLETEEFKPWKALIMSGSDAILLVEGETDREYFELLREEAHGSNRLKFEGEIVAYDGTGALQNTVLLRFIKNRYPRMFVTFDLDAAHGVERSLQALQLQKGTHYAPIGLDAPGKRNIEGFLPDRVTTAVYSANPSLVQAATSGTKDERESARNRLKKLLVDAFKKDAKAGGEDFGHFYQLAKIINRALS